MQPSLRILVLADRDWTHPDAGGTGTTLRALVSRWVAGGHHVTLIVGSYDGAVSRERVGERLEIHRMGSRLTVFPRAAWAHWRGIGRDADVIFEVVNGIAFFTPLWPRRIPTVAFVQHVHQDHYVTELGWRGRVAAVLLELLPLRHLYRNSRFVTISQSTSDELVSAVGVRQAAIDVIHLGVEPHVSNEPRALRPTLLYFGRLKRYKRLELLLDALEQCPGALLEVAGEGTHRAAIEAEIDARGLRDRVVMHGFVPEAHKPDIYSRAWLNVTTSSAEGWGLGVMEAASAGTPSVALRVGGLSEAIVDGETGVLADDVTELSATIARVMGDPALRERLAAAARKRAGEFDWNRTAHEMLEVMRAEAATRVSRVSPSAEPPVTAGLPAPLEPLQPLFAADEDGSI